LALLQFCQEAALHLMSVVSTAVLYRKTSSHNVAILLAERADEAVLRGSE